MIGVDGGTVLVGILLALISALQVVMMFIFRSQREDLRAVDLLASQNQGRIGVLEAERRHLAESLEDLKRNLNEKLAVLSAELRERRGVDREMTAAMVDLTKVLVKQLGGKEGR